MDFVIQGGEDGIYTLSAPEPTEWRESESLADELVDRIGAGPFSGLVIDLDNVEYMSSAGLGTIFRLRKVAEGYNASLVLARPNPSLLRLFKTVQVPDVIPVVDDLDEARRIAAGQTN
jgi:anti-anti-sigma factor